MNLYIKITLILQIMNLLSNCQAFIIDRMILSTKYLIKKKNLNYQMSINNENRIYDGCGSSTALIRTNKGT